MEPIDPLSSILHKLQLNVLQSLICDFNIIIIQLETYMATASIFAATHYRFLQMEQALYP